MKLMRLGPLGAERPAVRLDETFFAAGMEALRVLVDQRSESGEVRAFGDERIGAPIGQKVPDEPILFTRSPNTMVGPDDDVQIPRGSTKTDWEVELDIDGLGTQRQSVGGPR